ncbi:MAG: hypothetical protein LC808_14975 [Actinobacteria bacterium]|nr:hypothetical protein [Actinomycetota bacterium]
MPTRYGARMGEPLSRAELTAAADVLHRVLAEVDTGRLPADLDHAAYLRGAADTLLMLAGGCLKTKVTAHPASQATGGTFPQDS